jgi:glucokinase
MDEFFTMMKDGPLSSAAVPGPRKPGGWLNQPGREVPTALTTQAAVSLSQRSDAKVPFIIDRAARLGSARFAVGIEVLPYELVAVLIDHAGDRRGLRRWPLPDMDVDTVVSHVALAARELVGTSLGFELPSQRVGLGLQIGGPVEARSGTVLAYANHPTDSVYSGHAYHWREPVPLGALVQEETGCRTVVENDAAAYAIYEQRFGVGRESGTFAVILVRDGVGGGLVLDNELVPIPFEFGHIKVRPGGRKCVSGDNGCIDAYAGRRAVRAIVAELIGSETDVETIDAAISLADQDNGQGERVREAFHQAGHAVAYGIATILTLFGLSHVVIYGPRGMVDIATKRRAAAEFLRGVHEFPALTYPLFRNSMILARPLRSPEGAHGAALLALSQLFFVPLSGVEQAY